MRERLTQPLTHSNVVRSSTRALKRAVAATLTLGLSLVFVPQASAAETSFPEKPLKLVVNYSAGGPLDLIARAFSDHWQAEFGIPAVVENRPGAGGNIGANAVAQADPDGYTLLVTLGSTFTLNPELFSSMPFTLDDFAPVTLLGSIAQSVAVNAGSGITSFADLVAEGKKRSLTFSSSGNGSPGHLSSAMLADAAGIKIEHIPYKGAPAAAMAVLSGDVDAGVLTTPGLVQHVKSGKVRVLAYTGEEHSLLLPEVPTVAELGVPDVKFATLFLIMAPAGTPDAILKILQQQASAFLKRPEAVKRLNALDFRPLDVHGAAVTKQLQDNRARYAKVVESAGMRVD